MQSIVAFDSIYFHSCYRTVGWVGFRLRARGCGAGNGQRTMRDVVTLAHASQQVVSAIMFDKQADSNGASHGFVV